MHSPPEGVGLQAIRYNDKAVLQHCHLAHAFSLLESQEFNFMLKSEPGIVVSYTTMVVA